jgi:hypothetical protein
MKDEIKTRIQIPAITSYSADRGYNYASATSWPTIHMTIGSAVLILRYESNEIRDQDIRRLDMAIDG